MKKITLLFMFCATFGFSQTFTDSGPYDMQNGNGGTALTCGTADELNLPLTVSGVGTLGVTNVISSVTINITHTWDSDVNVSLISPSGGTTVVLLDGTIGGSGDNFTDTVFIDTGAALSSGAAPYTGDFLPIGGAMNDFNTASENADGDWVLFVCDDANGDVGVVEDWSITFVPLTSCAITALAAGTQTACDPGTNTYTQEVTVTYTDAPATGMLDVNGQQFAIGTSPQTVTLVGLTADGMDVDVMALFTDDLTCTLSATALFTAPADCTPTPANDDCANATSITMFNNGDMQDASAATNNGGFIADCSLGGMNDGVWYTFTVVDAGTINVDVTGVTGWDPEVNVYSGSCGAFVCEGDSDACCGGTAESVSFSATAGTQYWVNIGYWSNFTDGAEGPLTINVSSPDTATLDSTLSTQTLENELAFSYFPNPVKNNLTLKAQKDIQNVSVYNMLGQEVLRTTPNAVNSEVNMNALQAGAYFVKVTINNVTETVRVIKN